MKNTYVQISDQNDLQIVMSAPADYNPDIIEDLKNRMMDAYGQALELQSKYVFGNDEETTEEAAE